VPLGTDPRIANSDEMRPNERE